MKIESLSIRNFRGIRAATLPNLGRMVVIAGQNGSGKSCILDAIRLVKSVYGGYQQNEWHHWMGEFQINFANKDDLTTLTNKRNEELRITCEFSLHSAEREYLKQHEEELVRRSVWQTIYPELYSWNRFQAVSLASHLRGRESEIKEQTAKDLEILRQELRQENHIGEFILRPNTAPEVRTSKTLEILFTTFIPTHLGVIDYHGPHRLYGRETLQGINLNLDNIEQQRKAHALYNYANKYANVKSEMAGSYIKEILAKEAGSHDATQASLATTLKELFKTFFPEKEFLGPVPTADGSLSFPVRTGDGSTHDLNELSAGEKELLYGYLRLRNSAPRYSVVLLDEPELHLNPRLIKGLPDFYHNHLGVALDNQLWLVTHSDALLREAVGHDGFSVFHMQSASSGSAEQIAPLHAKEDIHRVIIDLVGDLAAYRPNAKLIIFEGENSDFDQKFVTTIFPEIQRTANCISVGNKQRVRSLHDVLQAALSKGEVPLKIYSITDSDTDEHPVNDGTKKSFSWDRYHIENYLLEPRIIRLVLQDITSNEWDPEEDVYRALRDCAEETLPQLIRHRLTSEINEALVSSIDLATNPSHSDVADALAQATTRSASRVSKTTADQYNLEKIKQREQELRNEYANALASDSWRRKFRGRDILKRFINKSTTKIQYEGFRNLIVSKMRAEAYQPEGMRAVIAEILSAG